MIGARTVSIALTLAAFSGRFQPVFAQEPPLRIYTTRDGLAHDRVNDILRDSLGYVWFATWEGVSRFDGRRIVSYGTIDGLPNPLVWRIAEDAHGGLWFATAGGGIARLSDEIATTSARGPNVPRQAFVAQHVGDSRLSDNVYDLAFDPRGCLWCWTAAGLFRGEPRADGFEFTSVLPSPAVDWSLHFLTDADGELVFIARDAVMRWRDGKLETTARDIDAEVGDLADVTPRGPRADGRWLVSHDRALFEFDAHALDRGAEAWRRIPLTLPEGKLYRTACDEHGVLWCATTRGLVRVDGDDSRILTSSDGLPDDWVQCVVFDPSIGLWLGTHRGGAAHVVDSGLESVTRAGGQSLPTVIRSIESLDGRIFASTDIGGIYEIGPRGATLVPGSDVLPFANVHLRVLQDKHGAWWLGTDRGVYRCDGPELDIARARPCGAEWGLSLSTVFGEIREDRDGAIWLSMLPAELYRLDPAPPRSRFERVAMPANDQPSRITCGDRAGAIWSVTNERLWRKRTGEWEPIAALAGRGAEILPRCMGFDRRGWMWIGLRFDGLLVTRDPLAETPVFEHWSSARGLASDAVYGFVDDELGRMYIATTKGLDRIDPTNGAIEHWTVADGLAGTLVSHVLIDRRGQVWAATSGGVSRLDPRRFAEPRAPPPTYLTRVIVGGEERGLPMRGAAELGEIVCAADESRWIFEWSGVDPAARGTQLFSIRLDGAESEWSTPSDQTSVHYAYLAPGSYRFLVRSASADGSSFGAPASVALSVLPPVWRRWWFIALAITSVAGLGFAVHRARLRRALALERVRTQIATDLHDDIGAGLAQIAILSEVAKRAEAAESRDVLGEVADLARGLRVSMSDLVWAVDPRKDTLGDLVRRVRQFASDMLGASGLELEFNAPDDAAINALELAPDRRRNLLYLCREAVTNIARHAGATHATIEIGLSLKRLRVSIRDDGRGFDTGASYRGNGLDNLRRRAAQLDAELTLDSAPGRGTRIEVDLPLRNA